MGSRTHVHTVAAFAALTPVEQQQLLHELQVHQIELELQNDELRRTQAALDTAQARYFDFYDLAPVGYVTVSDRAQILQANLTTAALLGLPRGKLIGKALPSFMPEPDADRFYLLCQQALVTAHPQSCELHMHQANGDTIWVNLQAIAVAGDDGTAVIRMVLSDITARKQLEARMARREADTKAILDGAADAIFINDRHGCIQYVNQQALQMLGFSRDELLGKPVTDITPPEDFELTRRMLAQLMTTGTLRYEPSLVRRDGSIVPTELNGTMLADGNGFAACRDITEQRQLRDHRMAHAVETEMAASRQQLRELVSFNATAIENERKHIAREVHDELGQVLTALRMDMSVLGMQFGSLDPVLPGKVSAMKAMVDRAIEGVRNVATRLRPTALDMGLAAAIESLCAEFAQRTATACAFVTQSDPIEINETRAVEIYRIVQESLTNISRYAQASQVHVTLRYTGRILVVEVRDDGRGFIAAEVQRVKSFGLLGMHERALALGGRLDIVSSPGKGTVVGLTIPLDPHNTGDLA